MISLKQYEDGECSESEYYSQFVEDKHKSYLSNRSDDELPRTDVECYSLPVMRNTWIKLRSCGDVVSIKNNTKIWLIASKEERRDRAIH